MASVAAAQHCSLHAVAQSPQSRRQGNVRAPAFVSAPLRATRTQQCRTSAASGSRRALVVVAAAATEGVGKLISKVEIPAFIPRQDLIDQLSRWAMIEVQENGVANCGTPCKVGGGHRARQRAGWWRNRRNGVGRLAAASRPPTNRPPCPPRSPACPYYPGQVTSFSKEGHGLWGFTVSFLKDGVSAADVRVSFDEEVTHKHEWVGRAAGLLPSEHLTPLLLLLL